MVTDDALTPDLDELDRLFIDELARDGRVTSSDLAALAGVSKATAASRVRRLIEEEVVRVTAVFDMVAAGFPWQTNCFISSTDGDVDRIATELAKLSSTVLVVSVLGGSDVMVSSIFADKADIEQLFVEQLPSVAGVGRIECDVVVKPLWFEPLAYNLIVSVDDGSAPLDTDVQIRPRPSLIDLDELDHSLIKMLRVDGRRSNRRIARDLDVSEGTIRTRIRRLQEVNLMRIVGMTNARRLGQTGHVLWMRVHLASVDPAAAAAALSAVPEVASVTAIMGGANLNVMAVAQDRRQIRDIVNAVRVVLGVAGVEHYELIRTLFYRSYFVRIPGRSVRESGEHWAVDRPASTQTAS